MQYVAAYNSPLGSMTMASDGSSLTGLWFGGQKYFGAGLKTSAAAQSLPVFDLTAQWLDIYFSGRCPDFTPPLCLQGTDFRRDVWRLLLKVPYGTTTTYKQLAQQLAAAKHKTAMAAQAVGSAVGHNPVSIIVPCHRVIGINGSLTGYAGGLGRKLALLKLEGINTAALTLPTKGTAL